MIGRRAILSLFGGLLFAASIGLFVHADVSGSDEKAVNMRLDGASSSASPVSKWELDMPSYYFAHKTTERSEGFKLGGYMGVYPGIDMVYYGNQGKLEFDFVVSPGGDPDRIRMAVEGAEEVSLDEAET